MKRAVLFALLFLVLMSGCTVQETVNPDLFTARFSESFPDFVFETDSMFYENDKCVVFVNSASGQRYAVEMTLDTGERIQKVSLACTNTDKADEFRSFAEKIIAVYASQEEPASVLTELYSVNNYSYFESQWYYYTFSKTEAGLFFGIENKKLSPEKGIGLTLRENDLITEAP